MPRAAAGAHRSARDGGWRFRLPLLNGSRVLLRELRPGDAVSLQRHLSSARVREFLAEGPTTVEGFRKFIAWTHVGRRHGQRLCFGVIPNGHQQAIGFLQMWRLDRDFHIAEWGIVLGERFWGTGLFHDCATPLLDYAFETVGVRRLEARTVSTNARSMSALARLGAVQEGTLRGAFMSRGQVADQVMWSILAGEWTARLKPPSLAVAGGR